MSVFEKLLKEKRPTLSKSSLKTYESILRNLYSKVFDKETPDLKDFDKTTNIINYLKDLPSNKRKTILSALVIITDKKEYRELMLDDIKNYNEEQAKQTKTETQEENWVDKDQMMKLYDTLRKNANILYKKSKLTQADLQDIQLFIILSLFSGFFVPPRRSKDYVKMKIRNVDTKTDNYIDKNEFIFNDYKTAKTYGQQKLEIPKALKTIINKWAKYNPTDYLLFDTSLNPLSSVKLNQRLNKLFGKKAGVNQMRKTYLTEKYGDLIETKKALQKDMADMGSSTIQEPIYIKK